MSAPLNFQLLRLSALLQLEQRARRAGERELEFLMVNDTAGVVPYQQAALFLAGEGNGRLVLSGVAAEDRSTPYHVWLDRVIAATVRAGQEASQHPMAPADLPEAEAGDWTEWFPANALWCPLAIRDGKPIGALILARSEPWGEGDRQLAQELSEAYAQCLALRRQAPALPFHRRWTARRRPVAIAAGAAALLIALMPIRSSVLAPAEIVPIDPTPIRAPFEGVVDTLHVAPNQPVHTGQVLVSLDRQQLQMRYEVAQKQLDMAREEYAAAAQEAMSDPKAKGQIAMLSSKVEQQQAEVGYDKDMLGRADLAAPADGIAVFDDSNEWSGKPVALGERIMMVASPRNIELEVQVPAASVVTFAPGAEVIFFSNVAPDRPSRATLTFASYSSAVSPEGVLSYAFRAKFDGSGDGLRLGLKGTAKIYGPRRILVLWALRRPIALVREWLSL